MVDEGRRVEQHIVGVLVSHDVDEVLLSLSEGVSSELDSSFGACVDCMVNSRMSIFSHMELVPSLSYQNFIFICFLVSIDLDTKSFAC